jgi:ribokinase
MSGRVIVVGSVNVDLVVRGARLPLPGETVNGGQFERHDGGKGGNQAVAAARLGADVRFIGAVGDDSFGVEARAALSAEGVDVSGLATLVGAATGIALILVDPAGENVISVASGANRAIGPAVVEAALARFGSLAGDVVLVVNEMTPAVVGVALRVARAAGALTILNPAPASGFDARWLHDLDILTPNERELAILAGVDAAELDPRLAARSLRVREATVVTLGAAGALLVARSGDARTVPSPAVNVVDTTGAGDAFNGALAASLAQGLELPEAARRAVTAGALATTRSGAREGMPTTHELETALRANVPQHQTNIGGSQ